MMFTPDFRVENEGSIFLLYPRNDAASDWIGDHLYDDDGNGPQWWGGAVVIEHRYIGDIVEGIYADGLEVA